MTSRTVLKNKDAASEKHCQPIAGNFGQHAFHDRRWSYGAVF